MPAGSYQNSSSGIKITITATCKNKHGEPVKSSITYTQKQANNYYDISNYNGKLEFELPPQFSVPTAW